MRANVYTQCAPLAQHQHLEIAPRLRRLDNAETVFAARDRDIGRRIAGDLQKHAGVWPALVGLTGRVQETRTEPEAGCNFLAVADHRTDVLQRAQVLLIAL